MILLLEHIAGVMLKCDARFLRNPIAKHFWQTSTLFCNDAVVAVAITQVVLDVYQTF